MTVGRKEKKGAKGDRGMEPLKSHKPGLGVQSFALAAMSALGVLPPVDAAVHADTSHERSEDVCLRRQVDEPGWKRGRQGGGGTGETRTARPILFREKGEHLLTCLHYLGGWATLWHDAPPMYR